MVKNLPAMQETQVQSLGREDLLEKGMATHSSILNEKTCLICMGVVQGSSYKSFKEIKDSDVLFCHLFLDFSKLVVFYYPFENLDNGFFSPGFIWIFRITFLSRRILSLIRDAMWTTSQWTST